MGRLTACFETRSDGYERWRSWEDGEDAYVYVHRLAAVAWGVLDDLGDDEYWCQFYEHHDADDGFRNMAYEVPVPPLQPDGDYDPDEPARFEIAS